MKKSFILHQWATEERYAFNRFPSSIFRGAIKGLVDGWLLNGTMLNFRLEVIYEN